ncbi:MAG TPA: ABC transporter substrate-binding protein [Chloroflexota bacterium]
MPLLGFLSEGNPGPNPLNDAFWDGMHALGWREGETIAVETRYAAQSYERLHEAAEQLVALQPDLIFGSRSHEAEGPLVLTDTIPIVTAGSSDPVGLRLVRSLERPGGNVTGLYLLAPEAAQRRLELLKQVVPSLTRFALIWDVLDQERALEYRQLRDAADRLGLELLSQEVRGPQDLERAFQGAADEHADAIVLLGGLSITLNRPRVSALAAEAGLPVLAPDGRYVQDGALLTYTPNQPDQWRRAASYADRILKGANPAELPMAGPEKYDLVVNLPTAQALGLIIPPEILAQATEVIR